MHIGMLTLYFGTPGWGWKLYGVGYGERWFVGVSLSANTEGRP